MRSTAFIHPAFPPARAHQLGAVQKEGALGRAGSSVSLFTALLIIFPTEAALVIALTATEVNRSLLGCAGSHPGQIRQRSVRLLQLHPTRGFGAGALL